MLEGDNRAASFMFGGTFLVGISKIKALAEETVSQLGQLTVSGSVARSRLNTALGKGTGNAHHIIPWSLRDEPLVIKAAEGGFNINGVENGIRLVDHASGGHFTYINDVRAAVRGYQLLNPNLTPQQAADLLRVMANTLREHLKNAPLPLH